MAISSLGEVSIAATTDAPARSLGWQTLLPPFMALAAVLLTRQVILALGLALLTASVVRFGWVGAIPSGSQQYVLAKITDPWNQHIAGFAITILCTVKITEGSGGTRAIVESAEGLLRSARSVKVGTFFLGILVFFDDYANTMLVGPSVRPLSDRYRVSRAKLAYIVDSTAAPIAGIALVSTWLGYEIGLLEQATGDLGLDVDGYGLLIQALPLRFYCIFCLVMVLLTSYLERDFGPMRRSELQARSNPIAATKTPTQASTGQDFWSKHRWLNAAVPMGSLVVCVILGLFASGGGFERASSGGSLFSLGFWQETVGAIENSERILFWSAVGAFALAVATSLLSRALSWTGLQGAIVSGLKTAAFPVAILICAWGLGAACEDLGTGPFLVGHLQGALPPVWVPLLTFVAAALVALATGTSWGTMAILVPAAIPLAHSLGGMVLLLPTVAAVLDGAIFGDHCSPVSDTTLLSCAATDCGVLEHVWTQLPYALSAMSVAAGAYFLASTQTLPLGAIYVLSLVGLVAIVFTFGKRSAPRQQPEEALP